MRYRTIPRTELKVSAICLGSMNWGQQNSEADGHEQLDYALTQGVNFIDTAELYPIPPDAIKQGRTEKYLGTWLAKRGKRDDLIIASKAAGPMLAIKGRLPPVRLDKRNILAAIDGTLKRLQTDYVDIYQMHWPDRTTNFFGKRGFENTPKESSVPIEETLEALAEVVKSGKARYIGISNETAWGVHEYLRLASEKGLPRIVSIQNQYSLINRTYEVGLSEMTMREEVAFLAYSPLSFGVLSAKYLGGAKPEGARFTLWDRSSARYNAPQSQEAIRLYAELAKGSGMTPATMALAFVNDRPFTTSTIVGATSLEQLKQDIASVDVKLSDDVLKEIAQIYKEHPDPHA